MGIRIGLNEDTDKFITLEDLSYDNIFIEKGFEFDGVTVKSPYTIIFSQSDLRKGILASCFHDFMCNNKDKYTRNYATNILVDLWTKNGLSKIKGIIVKISVNLYQILKNRWK